ncbi:MAG: DoxX family protein [Bacteroidetes bacterium]|nr:DoxX family protein [Bacteroidota bacterium]
MKKNKIIFWISTVIIAVLVGLTPILTWNDPQGIDMITNHLGYPLYFLKTLNVLKIIGGLVLLIPQVPARVKEWAYVGFAIDFIAATVSLVAVDGAIPQSFFPMIFMIILAVSYFYKEKIA